MKKGISIIIAALFILSAMGIGMAMAEEDGLNVEVESTFNAVGVGTMERSLLVQSEFGYKGQRLTEDMYTKYMGTAGPSNISISTDLYVYAGASDSHENESTTEIAYASTAFTSTMKRKICSQNYEAGVALGMKTDGISGMAFELGMLPDSSYIEAEGEIIGSAKFSHMVVDPTTRLKVVEEDTRLEGKYVFDWNAASWKLIYPGDQGDWLGCP